MMARGIKIAVFALLLVSASAIPKLPGIPGKSRPRNPLLLDEKVDDLSVPIQKLSVNSQLLPRSVLRDAARYSGIHDNTVAVDAPAKLAAFLDSWYRRNGYVLARVTARSPVRAGRLQFAVSEPKVAAEPVQLAFYAAAEEPPSPSDVNLEDAEPPPSAPPAGVGAKLKKFQAQLGLRDPITLPGSNSRPMARAQRLEAALKRARDAGVEGEALGQAELKLQALRRAAGLPTLGTLERMHAAGSLVAVGGSTRHSVISKALHLKPGEPFRWDYAAWNRLSTCGLFEEAEARVRIVPFNQPQQQQQQPGEVSRLKRSRVHFAEEEPPPLSKEIAAAPASKPQQRGGPDSVGIVVSVVETGSRPKKAAQHCRFEPGIALSAGRLAGEVSVHDTNFNGRNQQLRLDVAVRNSTELKCTLHDPRLGERFGFDARVFKKDGHLQKLLGRLPGLGGGGGDDESESTDGAPLNDPKPEGGGATAGIDFSVNGRANRWATVGFGASAEVVPVPTSDSGSDTPLLLNANLGAGTMASDGGIGGRRRGPLRAGARVSLARSLPFLAPACPDYWRLKAESKLALPLSAVLDPPRQKPPEADQAAAVSNERKWRRIGMPEVKYAAADGEAAPTASERPPLLQEIHSYLKRGALSLKTRATVAADSLPAYEAEALGGEAALVRGYEEHELGRALSSAGGTLELQVPMSGGTEAQPVALCLFTDVGGGIVRLPESGELGKRVGSCAGFGVRYGPFRIDYAFNRKGQRKVHVNLVPD